MPPNPDRPLVWESFERVELRAQPPGTRRELVETVDLIECWRAGWIELAPDALTFEVRETCAIYGRRRTTIRQAWQRWDRFTVTPEEMLPYRVQVTSSQGPDVILEIGRADWQRAMDSGRIVHTGESVNGPTFEARSQIIHESGVTIRQFSTLTLLGAAPAFQTPITQSTARALRGRSAIAAQLDDAGFWAPPPDPQQRIEYDALVSQLTRGVALTRDQIARIQAIMQEPHPVDELLKQSEPAEASATRSRWDALKKPLIP